jgi:hypothetical protein
MGQAAAAATTSQTVLNLHKPHALGIRRRLIVAEHMHITFDSCNVT